MTQGNAITWELVAAVMTVITFASAFIYRIYAAIAKAEQRTANLEKEFQDYRLKATKDFASLNHLEQFEARLTEAINRLAGRLDRIIEARKND